MRKAVENHKEKEKKKEKKQLKSLISKWKKIIRDTPKKLNY